MKRIVFLLLVFSLLCSLCACSLSGTLRSLTGKTTATEAGGGDTAAPVKTDTPYLKAVWISQFELSMEDKEDKSETAFRAMVTEMLGNCAKQRINTVIVQVRPFSDAFYPSEFFPATKYLSGTQGQSVGYDAFGIVIETAKTLNLSVQAWINPYRVSKDKDITKLSADNPARVWYEADKDTRSLIICDNGIYYNPASVEAQKLIISGAREIVRSYDVSAIHFDDYFYPSSDASLDAIDYEAYKTKGGTLSLTEWRRQNVSTLVSGVYAAIKAIKADVQFGISCSSDIDKNENALYADVREWCAKTGYVDYLMPQIYFGYENQSKPFLTTASDWAALVGDNSPVTLYCGIAAYKAGKEDENAGSGSQEWIQNNDILARQLTDLKNIPVFKGFAFFSYSYIFADGISAAAQKELENLSEIL